MKTHISSNSLQAQGKPWQIKFILSQWQKEAGPSAKVIDLIEVKYDNKRNGH